MKAACLGSRFPSLRVICIVMSATVPFLSRQAAWMPPLGPAPEWPELQSSVAPRAQLAAERFGPQVGQWLPALSIFDEAMSVGKALVLVG